MRKCDEFCKSLCREPTDPLQQRKLIQYQNELDAKSVVLRETHWARIELKLEELVQCGDLLRVNPAPQIVNYFADATGLKSILHLLLTLCIFGTGIASYVLIASKIELSEAVKQGVAVLGASNVSGSGWICLCVFWLCVCVYFHREYEHDAKQLAHSVTWLCKGCQVEGGGDIETVFPPLLWPTGPEEYTEFQKKATAVFVDI
eukprot:335873_1